MPYDVLLHQSAQPLSSRGHRDKLKLRALGKTHDNRLSRKISSARINEALPV